MEKGEMGGRIQLKVKGQRASGVLFNIESSTPFRKLIDAYCSRLGLQASQVRFMVDGARIAPEDTAEQLGLESEDHIDVAMEQTGGTDNTRIMTTTTGLSQGMGDLGFTSPSSLGRVNSTALLQDIGMDSSSAAPPITLDGTSPQSSSLVFDKVSIELQVYQDIVEEITQDTFPVHAATAAIGGLQSVPPLKDVKTAVEAPHGVRSLQPRVNGLVQGPRVSKVGRSASQQEKNRRSWAHRLRPP